MVADAILDCSARGDIVLDAFLGSGTTLIAAERTGRRCCGLELDPALCRYRHSPLADPDRRERPSCSQAAATLMTSPARRRPPMPPDDERDYEVGYGKPPRHTRFKKGQSGNSKRPPARQQEPVDPARLRRWTSRSSPPTMAGAAKITKREAIDHSACQPRSQGRLQGHADPSSAMLRDIESDTRPADPADPTFTEADEQIIQRIQARSRGEKE